MTNTFNIYSKICNKLQDIINPLQNEKKTYLIHYTNVYKLSHNSIVLQSKVGETILSKYSNDLWDNQQK